MDLNALVVHIKEIIQHPINVNARLRAGKFKTFLCQVCSRSRIEGIIAHLPGFKWDGPQGCRHTRRSMMIYVMRMLVLDDFLWFESSC